MQVCPLIGLGHFQIILHICRRYLHFRERENAYHRYQTRSADGQMDRLTDKYAQIHAKFEIGEEFVHFMPFFIEQAWSIFFDLIKFTILTVRDEETDREPDKSAN